PARPHAHHLARPRLRRRQRHRRPRPRRLCPGLRHPAFSGRFALARPHHGRDLRLAAPGSRLPAPMTIASAAILLFLILDPLGNIPVFLSLLRGMPAHRQRVVLVREMLIALGVLMAFLWGGKYALELMHLRQESVSIAGGIV